jgi:hypothetical protein
MDEHSGVRIDSMRIRRINADATFTLGFLLIPDPGRGQPSTPELNEAIAEIRMPGHTDQRFHALEVSQGTFRPARTSSGPGRGQDATPTVPPSAPLVRPWITTIPRCTFSRSRRTWIVGP